MNITKQEMHERKKIAKWLYNTNIIDGSRLYIKDIKRVEKVCSAYTFGIYHKIQYHVELKNGGGYIIETITADAAGNMSIYSANYVCNDIKYIRGV